MAEQILFSSCKTQTYNGITDLIYMRRYLERNRKAVKPTERSDHVGGKILKIFPPCLQGGGSLRRFGELASRSKPPLSNKGGTKNKKHYTLTSGKRCIYKAKPHFYSSDINCTYITMKIE